MPGDALCADDPTLKNGAPAVQAGEVYDRYRSFEGKGLAYSLLHLRELTLIAEVAANNSVSIHGADPYHITGTLGRGLEAAYTFYADFFLTGDASVRGGYYAKEKVIPPDACLYELARRHFPGNEKIRQVVAARDRTTERLSAALRRLRTARPILEALFSNSVWARRWDLPFGEI